MLTPYQVGRIAAQNSEIHLAIITRNTNGFFQEGEDYLYPFPSPMANADYGFGFGDQLFINCPGLKWK